MWSIKEIDVFVVKIVNLPYLKNILLNMNTISFALVTLLVYLHKTESLCVNVLNMEEQKCAGTLAADTILSYYLSNSQLPIFGEYLKCTWEAFNLTSAEGDILYDNLKNIKSWKWTILRDCDDFIDLQLRGDNIFKNSVNICQNTARGGIMTPLSVTRCIRDVIKSH
ncbi:uncharacterized protein LOC116177415 [Photinus pyralis]|uniref:uncharacterized protein LOC116162345 n=1 Tax=Photinus pyralis TaxID=7054 RepID=UPI001267670A|nr:uncharacterized protein LOC116162345 [Photinus pyralis]XP_031352248.1 uncharacterized protein LOC116177415 [Photinus pyralis]